MAETDLDVKSLLSKLREQQPDLGAGTREVREALKAVKAESETKATAPMQPPQPPLLPPRSLLPPHRPLPRKARAFARGAEPRLHRLLPAAVGYG